MEVHLLGEQPLTLHAWLARGWAHTRHLPGVRSRGTAGSFAAGGVRGALRFISWRALWLRGRLGHGCQLEDLLDAEHSIPDIGLDGNQAPLRRYLHRIVGVVGHRHELGQRRAAKYAIVREGDVSDIKRDALRLVVLSCAKRHWQHDLP